MNRQATHWDKKFIIHIFVKGLVSATYKQTARL